MMLSYSCFVHWKILLFQNLAVQSIGQVSVAVNIMYTYGKNLGLSLGSDSTHC